MAKLYKHTNNHPSSDIYINPMKSNGKMKPKNHQWNILNLEISWPSDAKCLKFLGILVPQIIGVKLLLALATTFDRLIEARGATDGEFTKIYPFNLTQI